MTQPRVTVSHAKQNDRGCSRVRPLYAPTRTQNVVELLRSEIPVSELRDPDWRWCHVREIPTGTSRAATCLSSSAVLVSLRDPDCRMRCRHTFLQPDSGRVTGRAGCTARPRARCRRTRGHSIRRDAGAPFSAPHSRLQRTGIDGGFQTCRRRAHLPTSHGRRAHTIGAKTSLASARALATALGMRERRSVVHAARAAELRARGRRIAGRCTEMASPKRRHFSLMLRERARARSAPGSTLDSACASWTRWRSLRCGHPE
jgi:hypothetical protein